MVIRPLRFNIYLLLPLLVGLAAGGCQSNKSKEDKQMATMRVHLETNPNPTVRTEIVNVLRAAPIAVCVEQYPFLNESHISEARVAETEDGFKLVVQFNQLGQRLLEQYSAANSRRRFAIRSQFRHGTNVFDRWLGAPLVSGRIPDGIIAFTPDADRTEADLIVKGWNNVAEVNEPKKKKKKKSAE